MKVDGWLLKARQQAHMHSCPPHASLRGLIKFLWIYIYIVPLADHNLESEKHMCVVDLDFRLWLRTNSNRIAWKTKIQDFTFLDDFDQPLLPHVGFRVSGESTHHVAPNLKSTLVSAEVMAKHLMANGKLGKDLKQITLEDHQCHRSSYYNCVGIVRLYCVKCCK